MEFLAKLQNYLKNTKLRLKKIYGWEDDFINEAVNEYGKFLLLHKRYKDIQIFPGKVVDQVWHDHILHTQSYFTFCDAEFGCYIHHKPYDLSLNEKCDTTKTIELYEKEFGYKPSTKFWFDYIKMNSSPQKTFCDSDCRCG